MTLHAKYPLRGSGILEILNLLFTVPTSKTRCTERLISRQDGKILDLVPASTTTICTIVADERPVAEEKKICIGVEQGATGIAAEAVDMPTIARWERLSITASQRNHD